MLLVAVAGSVVSETDAQAGSSPRELIVGFEGGRERVVELPAGSSLESAARRLQKNESVVFAVPNYRAYASETRGSVTATNGAIDWRDRQWNFLSCGSFCERPLSEPQSPGGIDAPGAWEKIEQAGRQPGAGARVAVLDSGIRFPPDSQASDFASEQFLPGWDFVNDDSQPLDSSGHGTHVTATIAELNDNGFALNGLAPAAKIIPVQVLNAKGVGTASTVAKGIRFAVKKRADVINLAFDFRVRRSCRELAGVCREIAKANAKGVLVVASSGNAGGSGVAYPAAAPNVLAVGGSTRDACPAANSRYGKGLDLVAPSGGAPRTPARDCRGDGVPDLDSKIAQFGFIASDVNNFGLVERKGTSMSAAHATGVAALVISSRILGLDPSPRALTCQIKATARRVGLGSPYSAKWFGAGLLDARSAVASRAAKC